MEKYYFMLAGKQYGPFEISELTEKIKPETFVWCNGMADWKQAKDVPDLAAILPVPEITPPKFTHDAPPEKLPTEKRSKKKALRWFLIVFALTVVALGANALYQSQNNNTHSYVNDHDQVNDNDDNKTHQDATNNIRAVEIKNPLSYIKATAGNQKITLIGNDWLDVVYTNSATVMAYKDFTIQIGFISKTGTTFQQLPYKVYERVGPQRQLTKRIYFKSPKGTERVNVHLTKAVATN